MIFRRLVSILMFVGIEANPMGDILLSTDFSLSEGPAIEAPDALWKHHSGASGEVRIEEGQLHLIGSQSEDVHATLAGSPWNGDKTEYLYVGFSMRCNEKPGKLGGYFAHFLDAKNGHRCRVFAKADDTDENRYRLGISISGADPDTLTTTGLSLNEQAVVILRYSLIDATGTLWVNPESESDTSISAQDASTTIPITALAFRQASGIGSIWIDNVVVGTTFSDIATNSLTIPGIPGVNTNVSVSDVAYLFDRFDYKDGPLCEVSSGVWRRHSGASNEIAVASGVMRLSEKQSEDVNVAIPGAPYSGGACLYAGFTVVGEALPSGPEGSYFAHFKDGGNGYRCRIFDCTNGAAMGFWRLGIASAANTASASSPTDLALRQPYRVVVRLDSGSGASTLWIDPKNENDPSASASDSAKGIPVSAFAFRQSYSAGSGIGVLCVDDLCIGPSMRSVLSNTHQTEAALLSIDRTPDGRMKLRWPADPARTYSVWASDGLGAAFVRQQMGLAFPDGSGLFEVTYPDNNIVGFFRISIP